MSHLSSIPPNEPATAERPRVAVVIGSGGVRSIAGLGLIDTLKRAGLDPDLIVGCSAGAIFGAVAAAGHAVDEGLALATRLWTAEITRTPRRLALAQMVLPKVGGFGPDFALRCDRLVMERLERAFGDQRLEWLTTPLRVTATDAASGSTVQLTQGRVVDALRASIALPFMFAPKTIDGRRLVDGFLTDPLPVQAALDAELIVALGVEAPMPTRVDRPARMLAQVTSTMTNSLMHARIAAARGAGARVVTVLPRLGRRVGLFDTDAMPELVDLGRQAAEAALPEILAAVAEADSPALRRVASSAAPRTLARRWPDGRPGPTDTRVLDAFPRHAPSSAGQAHHHWPGPAGPGSTTSDREAIAMPTPNGPNHPTRTTAAAYAAG